MRRMERVPRQPGTRNTMWCHPECWQAAGRQTASQQVVASSSLEPWSEPSAALTRDSHLTLRPECGGYGWSGCVSTRTKLETFAGGLPSLRMGQGRTRDKHSAHGPEPNAHAHACKHAWTQAEYLRAYVRATATSPELSVQVNQLRHVRVLYYASGRPQPTALHQVPAQALFLDNRRTRTSSACPGACAGSSWSMCRTGHSRQ